MVPMNMVPAGQTDKQNNKSAQGTRMSLEVAFAPLVEAEVGSLLRREAGLIDRNANASGWEDSCYVKFGDAIRQKITPPLLTWDLLDGTGLASEVAEEVATRWVGESVALLLQIRKDANGKAPELVREASRAWLDSRKDRMVELVVKARKDKRDAA